MNVVTYVPSSHPDHAPLNRNPGHSRPARQHGRGQEGSDRRHQAVLADDPRPAARRIEATFRVDRRERQAIFRALAAQMLPVA